MKYPYSMVMATLAVALTIAADEARCEEEAHAAAGGASALAKATQNPVADLTSIPFQFNYNSGGGLGGQTLFNLNFQPVVPLRINDDWTLIARTIVPYLNIPVGFDSLSYGVRATGIGDIQEQAYITPKHPGDVIWGAGLVLSFPTATNDFASTGDWAAGPALVLLKMTGSWVIGGLLNQLWTYAGDDNGSDVNTMLFQPFINYNIGKDGWALAFAPIITANWSAPDGEEWTVPLGIGVSKVAAIGTRPVSLGIQYYHNVEAPSTSGDNQIRFQASFLYPIKKG